MTQQELEQFLADNPPAAEFKPYCYVNPLSDALTAYFAPDADYSQQVYPHLTLYRSLETDRVVGIRIDGLSTLAPPEPPEVTP